MSDYGIGVDFHCKYQRVAWLNRETGETDEADLRHEDEEEVRKFYEGFPPGTVVGMEAGGYSWWFGRLLEELGHEGRIGDPGVIARKRDRRQKNNRRDALHVRRLIAEGNFPQIWRPSVQQREQKRVIRYRVKLARERTRGINTLRAQVYNFNLHLKRGALSAAAREKIRGLSMGAELEALRDEMLERIGALDPRIRQLDQKIHHWATDDPQVVRVMGIAGLGPITSLYLVLTLGEIRRFSTLKQVVAYVGLDSVEGSSDNLHKRRRYGSISKQGDRTLRWLLVQCAVSATRHNAVLKRFYRRLLQRKGMPVARCSRRPKAAGLGLCAAPRRDRLCGFVRRGSVRDLPVKSHGPV
jgi:transposase